MRSHTPAVLPQAGNKEAAAEADFTTAGEQKKYCMVRAANSTVMYRLVEASVRHKLSTLYSVSVTTRLDYSARVHLLW